MMELETLLEFLKVALGVATLGGVKALHTFVKRTSEETMQPLARDLVIVTDRLDELRVEFDDHIGEHHGV